VEPLSQLFSEAVTQPKLNLIRKTTKIVLDNYIIGIYTSFLYLLLFHLQSLD